MEPILHIAVKLLARRSHSKSELRRKLQTKSYSDQDIENALEILEQRKLLDDMELAQRLFEQYGNAGKYSLKMILLKLKQHGFSNSVIHFVLSTSDDYDEYPAAKKLANQSNQRRKDPLKLSLYLSSKGFTKSTINQVLINNSEPTVKQ